jgi:hypothetical protein
MQWQQLCCCVHLPVCPIDAATAILSLQHCGPWCKLSLWWKCCKLCMSWVVREGVASGDVSSRLLSSYGVFDQL